MSFQDEYGANIPGQEASIPSANRRTPQTTSTVNTGDNPRGPLSFGTPKDIGYKPRGVGRSFSAQKYAIDNYSYPSNIMDQEYGGNYVIFYINVAEDSKLIQVQKAETVADIDPRDRGELIGANYSSAELATATGLAGAGLGSIVGAGGGFAGGGLIGGGLGLAAGAVIAKQAPTMTRAQRRLKTAIALHIPNTLNISYSVSYDEDSTAGLAMLAQAGRTVGDIVKSIQESPSKMADIAKNAGKQLLESGGGAATALALNVAPGGVGAAAGLAANPKKEQIFKGVDFRTFTFDYQFYPRDSKEAGNVLRIIEQFKYHMHPEFKDNGGFVYIYPSEFDVVYYQGAMENRNIHRHTSCVLTNMNVNYTPQGQFTTFADGMPTQINVTLTFKELALLTKDKVEDGL